MPFDIGFWELCVIGVVALVVLGPDRLPGAAKQVGLWVRKIKQALSSVKQDINRELEIEELRQQIAAQKTKMDELLDSSHQSVDEMARDTQQQIEASLAEFKEDMEEPTIYKPYPPEEDDNPNSSS